MPYNERSTLRAPCTLINSRSCAARDSGGLFPRGAGYRELDHTGTRCQQAVSLRSRTNLLTASRPGVVRDESRRPQCGENLYRDGGSVGSAGRARWRGLGWPPVPRPPLVWLDDDPLAIRRQVAPWIGGPAKPDPLDALVARPVGRWPGPEDHLGQQVGQAQDANRAPGHHRTPAWPRRDRDSHRICPCIRDRPGS